MPETTGIDIDLNDELFLKALGAFLRRMRIAAGFTTIRSFVDTIDISYSQYQGYETGKINITILNLKRILFELNIKPEVWLNLNIFDTEKDENKLISNIRQARIEQLIEQVKIKENSVVAHTLGRKELQRYIDILIFCNTSKKRKEILVGLLKMDDSSNTLKRVAGKLLEYGWLDYTDRKNKNNPAQQYYTTSEGKKALKLSSSIS